MQFAQNDLFERIQPQPDLTGFCPGCSEKVFSKCGEINIHHFAHFTLSNCEGGKGETEWHRAWKERFPISDRERYETNEFQEKRIADVRYCGHVFEFQTQLPSCEEIRSRQDFWTEKQFRFVWVFKREEKLIAKKLEHGLYRVWNFSQKFDDVLTPFFLDDPSSGWCLRVDDFDRTSPTKAECFGQFMPRGTADLWIGPLT